MEAGEGTHTMTGLKVGGHHGRGEVRLSQCAKRPRELGVCPSITWAQESRELSVPTQRLGREAQGAWMEHAPVLFGYRSPESSVWPSIVWALRLGKLKECLGIVWAHKVKKKNKTKKENT